MALGTPRAREALPLVLEGAALLRAAGAHHFAAGMLTSVGMAALREDEYAVAEEAQAAALDAARADGGDAHAFALVSGNMGLGRPARGPYRARAGGVRRRARHRPCARLHAGSSTRVCWAIAAVAAARGEDRRAAILEAAACRHGTVAHSEAEAPVYERVVQRFIAPAQDRLGDATWRAAQADGRAMTADTALDYALQAP